MTRPVAPVASVQASDVEARHIVRSELAGIALGVDARRVSAIEDAEGPDSVPGARLDLALLLGFEPPRPSDTPRRALVVTSRGRVVRLVIGETVRVERMASDAFRPVPAFIEGMATRAGIGSVFLSGDGVGYVVDVDRLALEEPAS
jgi:hypothetical protein